jgi:type II secretory pathway component GspD/PulD (secretin)
MECSVEETRLKSTKQKAHKPMTKLADLEKAIVELSDKVNSLIIKGSYEQKDLSNIEKKVELLEKQVAQVTFVIRLQTFIAAVVLTGLVTYIFKHL